MIKFTEIVMNKMMKKMFLTKGTVFSNETLGASVCLQKYENILFQI